MKWTQYKGDGRLWLRITLLLFVVSWCVPLGHAFKGPELNPPVRLLWQVMTGVVHGDATGGEVAVPVVYLLCFTGTALSAAIIVSWFLQCGIVIVRTKNREKTDHAA